jgi:hypothetical protein
MSCWLVVADRLLPTVPAHVFLCVQFACLRRLSPRICCQQSQTGMTPASLSGMVTRCVRQFMRHIAIIWPQFSMLSARTVSKNISTALLIVIQVWPPANQPDATDASTIKARWAVSRASGHRSSRNKIWYLFQHELIVPEYLAEFSYSHTSTARFDAVAAAATAAALAKQPEALRPMCHHIAPQLALADGCGDAILSSIIPPLPTECTRSGLPDATIQVNICVLVC